ncbi:hypothetical protein FG93_04991 [Bosea sp. LC85]|nr:hypothetical protein FG93_04991 [Bosea sp. LC85]
MRHALTDKAFAVALVLTATSPAWAQDQRPAGSSQSLTCSFSGDHGEGKITFNGRCSGALDFSLSVQIERGSASRTRGHERTFRQGTGPIADL